MKAMILGCSGLSLSPAEAAFFKKANPWGFILFGRNVESLDQVRALTDALRESVGRNAPIFVDQEGGTVRRLRPPLVRHYPSAASVAALFKQDPDMAVAVAHAIGRLMASDLIGVGINADCAPVLDMPPVEGEGFIADRAYGSNPAQVEKLARAVAEGLLAGGVLPVIKHMPGHGRGFADSHAELPVVDTPLNTLKESDFAPFCLLRDMPMAMTCHVVFSAVDPERPASTSPILMQNIIRGEIGFDGLVISDDISMNALSGDIRARAKAVAASGTDIVLHCNGDMAEMQAVSDAAPRLCGRALQRAEQVMALAPVPDQADLVALNALVDRHLPVTG